MSDDYAVFDGKTGHETVLNNGRRTAVHWGDANEGGARSLSYRATGSYYFEVSVHNYVGDDSAIGLIKRGGVYNDMHYGNAEAIAFFFHDGSIWNSDTEVKKLGEVPKGSRVDVAVDLDLQQLWLRINDGSWQGMGDDADPETGVGGFSFASFQKEGAAIMALYAGPNTGKGDALTLNAGSQEFSGYEPAGFEGWPR